MKYLFFVIILCFLAPNNIIAQYYYNDIIAIEHSNQQQALFKQNKIKIVKAISKESDGSVIEDFVVEQRINEDASEIITYSKTSAGNKSTLKTFFANTKISKTDNQEDGVQTVTSYTYQSDGKLHTIESSTIDTFITTVSTETHIWLYNAHGSPEKMYKIKNTTDTITVNFVVDDKNLVVEEHWYRKGKNIESYFYYYNNQNLLTDIVRYNSRVKKMLPDFMYEYDTTGNLKKMIQVLAGGSNYNTWFYFYNAITGLKEKEVCYDKKKQLLGSIEYSYNN
ncbi:MAG: hypothetical protein KF781_05980 [Chitinophagaceae bacterium]|nr:hypothetical protein [Chitinophagaceae bacterium]MCW5906055.1 hypothetical protein [Chitinophagaceae bacterium]